MSDLGKIEREGETRASELQKNENVADAFQFAISIIVCCVSGVSHSHDNDNDKTRSRQ